ncbi:MAG: formate/nitrite transporter family protein [Lachnospiraceae bacterium]|nr:formate/nitrite transporter family protein [Lachnospiraceae bacterium]
MNFFTPAEVAKNTIGIGKGKAALSASRMLLLGIMAGIFIGFAGVACTMAGVGVPIASTGKLVGAAIFPGGLAMVLLAGSELFTGNSLMIVPLLEKEITLGGMLKNWGIVWVGNLIGGMLVAAGTAYGHTMSLFGNGYGAAAISTAATKCSLTLGDALIRGILCNILVCVAVWISFAAKDVVSKIVGIFFPVTMFVFSGFEHSIADMYFVFAGYFGKTVPAYAEAAVAAGTNLDAITLGTIFGKCLIPVSVGNVMGGAFVACVYWYCFLKKDKK